MQYQIVTLEQIGQAACFAVEKQKKAEAQSYFYGLAKNISLPLLQDIIKNGSDILVFVTFEYLNKLLKNFNLQLLREIFATVENQVQAWFNSQIYKFIRSDPKNPGQLAKIPKYLQNTIQLLLSNCLKIIFSESKIQKRSQLVDWINNKSNPEYRLWLYHIFLKNVSQIDSSMGYIKFRTLSYSFQEQVVPVIAKVLIPFLARVGDIIKINQISSLQDALTVNQEDQTKSGKCNEVLFVNENQQCFAQVVFEVLHSIVFYNFHLTYTQYEQESCFENCLICFPDEFIQKVLTQQFLSSFAYLMLKLIDSQKQTDFLKLCLETLQKICLAKLSFVNQSQKQRFVKDILSLLTALFRKPKTSRYMLTKIFLCANKFLINIQVTYLLGKETLKEIFDNWLESVMESTMRVLNNLKYLPSVNSEQENILVEIFELHGRILSSLAIHPYSYAQESMTHHHFTQYIKGHTRQIVKLFLFRFLHPVTPLFMAKSTLQFFKSNITELRSYFSSFLHPFRQIASYSYFEYFNQLYETLKQSINGQCILITQMNILMLMTESIDRNFLERSVLLVKATDEQVQILARSFQQTMILVINHAEQHKSIKQNPIEELFFDVTQLVFLDKTLSEFLSVFDSQDDIIHIKHGVFRNMLKNDNIQDTKKIFSQNLMGKNLNLQINESQMFIFSCIGLIQILLLKYDELYKHIQQNTNQFSFQGLQEIATWNIIIKNLQNQIFECVNKLLMKFKWGLKRQLFKKSQTYQMLTGFLTHVSLDRMIKSSSDKNLEVQFRNFKTFQKLKWRRNLLKIMSLLFFDDIIDDYKDNIARIISTMKKYDCHILNWLLDLQGAFLAIDTGVIYRFFLQNIQKEYPLRRITQQACKYSMVFEQQFKDPMSKKSPRVKIIKKLLKLHTAIILNRGQRLSNNKNSTLIYQLIQQFIPYWTEILKQVTSDSWNSVLKQFTILVLQMIKSDKINFFLLERLTNGGFQLFFSLLLQKIIEKINTNALALYPKFNQKVIEFMATSCREVIGMFFMPVQNKGSSLNLQQQKVLFQNFIFLFYYFLQKIPEVILQMKTNGEKCHDNVQKYFQIIKFTLNFINFKRRTKQIHSQNQQKKKINFLTFQLVQKLKQPILKTLKEILFYLMDEKSFNTIKRLLIMVIYQGIVLYNQQTALYLFGDIQLPTYLNDQLTIALKNSYNQQSQLFIDHFKSWLRMLHMTEEEVKKKNQAQNQFYGFATFL